MKKTLPSNAREIALIVAVSLINYSNIFFNSFTFDDKVFILSWQTIKNLNLLNTISLFLGNVPYGHEGVYRPLRGLLYEFYYHLFGANLAGYHIHALFILILSSLLVYGIIKHITRSKTIAIISGVLFAAHPIHTEAITWIISGMDTTGDMLFLLAFYAYIKSRGYKKIKLPYYFTSVFFAVMSFFTLEIAIVLPFVIMLYDYCFKKNKNKSKKEIFLSYAPYLLAAVSYAYIRIFILHIGARSNYLGGSAYFTLLTMMQVLTTYVFLLFFPLGLASNHVIAKGIESMNYGNSSIHAITSQTVFTTKVFLGICIMIISLLTAFFYRHKKPLITFGILWFFITLIPVSQIIPQETILSERWLFLPSVGFILLIAFLLDYLKGINKKITVLICICLIIFYSYQTIQRNQTWHNSLTRWTADVQNNSADNSYAYFALGSNQAFGGNHKNAIQNYRRALEIRPSFALAYLPLALAEYQANHIETALSLYQKALHYNPSLWQAHYNLAIIYQQMNNAELQKKEYNIALSIPHPAYQTAINNLGYFLIPKNYKRIYK